MQLVGACAGLNMSEMLGEMENKAWDSMPMGSQDQKGCMNTSVAMCIR